MEQTQQLPSTYNKDEVARKIEQERQIVEVDKKLVHIIDMMEDSIKDRLSLHVRVDRNEITLYGKDYVNGLVQRVDSLSTMKTYILCTLSALGSSGLTITVAYLIKHI